MRPASTANPARGQFAIDATRYTNVVAEKTHTSDRRMSAVRAAGTPEGRFSSEIKSTAAHAATVPAMKRR